MTLAELIDRYRLEANDQTVPPLVADLTLTGLFNEAERHACIRARLIHEHADPAICEIAVVAGTSSYPLHAALYELDYTSFLPMAESRKRPVRLVSQEWLDGRIEDWRDLEGDPEYAIQSDTAIRLVPRPDRAGTFFTEGYRTPKAVMVETTDRPEINGQHHEKLVYWVLHRVFSMPDSELINPARAAQAEAEFTAYFGPLPDADLRRTTREDVPHAVVGFLP